MKAIQFRGLMVLIFSISLVACNLPAGPGSDSNSGQVSTTVAQTLQALTPQVTSQSQSSASQESSAGTSVNSTQYPSPTSEGTTTSEPGKGSISGSVLGYPYGSLPKLVIVAIQQEAPYSWWYELLPSGNSYYSMDGYVSTGNYQVVAYDASGNRGGCTSLVLVKDGEMATCEITDWGGGYPAKPSGAPSP